MWVHGIWEFSQLGGSSYLSSLINLQSAGTQLGVSALETGELLAGAVGVIESALSLPIGGFPGLIHMTVGQGSKKN